MVLPSSVRLMFFAMRIQAKDRTSMSNSTSSSRCPFASSWAGSASAGEGVLDGCDQWRPQPGVLEGGDAVGSGEALEVGEPVGEPGLVVAVEAGWRRRGDVAADPPPQDGGRVVIRQDALGEGSAEEPGRGILPCREPRRAGGGYEIRTREGVNPTRFPSERHRPLGESSVGERT